MQVVALILAGGSGSRLWPLSTDTIPKPFLSLIGERSLLQQTCLRLVPLESWQKLWIITGKEHEQLVIEQISALKNEHLWQQDKQVKVLMEPESKNTAPAILGAAYCCQKLYGDDTVLLVLPSDHFITLEKEFLTSVSDGIEKAGEGYLVAFGVKPSYPETGYGYIKMEGNARCPNGPGKIAAFVEKPDRSSAEEYIKAGNYLWNSGMFAFHVGTLLAESQRLCPEIAEPILKCNDLFDPEELKTAYAMITGCSIDYAIMEKTCKGLVIPAAFGWSDVGSWQSFYEVSPKDESGNISRGNHIVYDSRNCLLYGSDRVIAAVGLDATAIIDTPDALLVCPLNQTHRVKEILEVIKQRGKP